MALSSSGSGGRRAKSQACRWRAVAFSGRCWRACVDVGIICVGEAARYTRGVSLADASHSQEMF
eukprot:4301110-Lingulodinium_polyedra.AAC.1